MQIRRLLTALTAALVTSAAAISGDLYARVNELMIPKMDVEDMPITEVFEFLRKESKRLDPDHAGVNFFFKLRPGQKETVMQREVTMSFAKLSLAEVIRYVCMAADLNYTIEDRAVIIADVKTPLSKMETRYYRVKAGVFDAKKTRKSVPRFDLDDDDN
ncbi:MAG: hypothetical protein HN742_25185 [Lentisphaerae bacterium]|jgi:hypothetical protein|nr:hypothetical protein [Lentisphaerota bacterium]MBT4816774.1 hypothetical protein [Lentisphaerota bacterium]MBT5607575.1 hypothetical protein [Lentisphaerota bacterium]MBT7054564.1 hypothetical protein [Lentisphaerota bacterium]MBT7845196.1 hypothetical protein [Lentisphaerota bacterium]